MLATEVLASEGYPLLDRQARDLIRRASPLPPLPPDLAGDTVELIAPIELSLQGETRLETIDDDHSAA